MSEESDKSEDSQASVDAETTEPNPIKRLTLIVLMVGFVFLCWYLLADRFTPYTSEARVRGYVVPIATEISGMIEQVMVDNDQVVKAGDVLLQLDPEPYQLAVNRAEAELEDVAQTLGAGQASVAAAEVALVSAETNLTYVTRQAQRAFDLEDQGLLSELSGDTMRTKLEQAKIAVSDAEANLLEEKTRVGITGEENPRYQSALSALQQAQLDLKDTTLLSPAFGVITNIKASEGYFATAGAPIVTFVSTKAVWVEAYMRENSLGNIDKGDSVDIVLDVAPGQIFKGKVLGIGYGIDWGQKDPAGELPDITVTRGWLREPQRFPVLIEFDGDESEGFRRVGGQADVVVYTGDSFLLNGLGKLLIRTVSYVSFLN